jgi:hypothetical protein
MIWSWNGKTHIPMRRGLGWINQDLGAFGSIFLLDFALKKAKTQPKGAVFFQEL